MANAGHDGDGVLAFTEWVRETLIAALRERQDGAGEAGGGVMEPGWAWTMARVLSCCRAYPGGVTEAILLSELFQAWAEKERVEAIGKGKLAGPRNTYLQTKKRRQQSIPNIASIDSIMEKKLVSLDAVMEVVILDIKMLPGTSTYLLTLGDVWSGNTIDHYLHRKYYDMVQEEDGILKKGREIRLTGCRLRTALVGSGPRLLPTEYLVTLLDEEQDEDAMFLGAQFCSDTFTSMQLPSADYYFYARLEKSIEVEMRGKTKHLKQQQLLLVDSNGDSMPFILWDEQIRAASLLSEGSMVAIERPFVTREVDCDAGACLEYGSATRLYSVPFVQREKRVTVGSTQSRSKLETQGIEKKLNGSQVSLPCDSQGSIDFNRYPFRLLIEDLRPKMFNAALYGLVAFAGPRDCSGICKKAFLLTIKDDTGLMEIELNFTNTWTAGEVFQGQTIFISGLTTYDDTNGRLRCSWVDNAGGALLVNVSRLPAIISSPRLHFTVPVHNKSNWTTCGRVCRVRLGKVHLEQLQVKWAHVLCGQAASKVTGGPWFCGFCQCHCDTEIMQLFHGIVSLYDTVEGSNAEIRALVAGQAALSVLQVSPESFCTWPEDEQALYLFSLEGEEFIISFYQEVEDSVHNHGKAPLRVACAMKSEQRNQD